MPSEAEFVATLESGRKLGKVPNLQADPEGLKKFAPTTPVAERPALQQALPDSYPPLENPTR
jgi:outer membrane protein assembly factor BamE